MTHILSILIADDHPIVRAGLRAVLEQQGWQVDGEADNGETAVQLARDLKPDIVVLDYSLPLLNGLDTTRAIYSAAPGVPVLVYTMHDDEGLIRDILKAGARGYLLKSEDDTRLVEAIKALSAGKTYFSQRVMECLLHDVLGSTVLSPPVLTPREREIVKLIAQGNANKTIANRLNVSVKTVDTHRTSAMRKLNLRSAVELTRYAIRNKWIEL